MDEVTFLATWDETGSIGSICLTKAELEELITSTDSPNGKHVISISKFTFVVIGIVLTLGYQKSDESS